MGAVVVLLSGAARAQGDAAEKSDSTAQRQAPASGGVFFNPLGLVFGYLNAEVSIGALDLLAVNLGGSYYWDSSDTVKETTYSVGAGIQAFPVGQLYSGFFVYPSVLYAKTTAEATILDTTSTAEASLMGLGGIVGYQWDWRPFSLRLGGGFRYLWITAEEGDGTIELQVKGFAPALDASIGFTF